MNRATITLAILCVAVALAPTKAAAVSYDPNKPLVYLYQNKAGFWFGCGPSQCLLSGWDTYPEAFEHVVPARLEEGDWQRLGTSGRCTFYQGEGELESYDRQPERIMRSARDDCPR